MPRNGPLRDLSDAHRQLIADLYAGSSLSRDDLPYTDEFNRIHTAFCEQSGRKLSQHDFWRALASIGKGAGLRRKER